MARLRNRDKQRGTGRRGRKGYNEAKEAMNINNMEFKVETLLINELCREMQSERMKFYKISCLFPYQAGISTQVVLWTFVVPPYWNLRFDTRTWNLSWDFLDLNFDVGFRIEFIFTGRPDVIDLTSWTRDFTWHQTWLGRVVIDLRFDLTLVLTQHIQAYVHIRADLTFIFDQTSDLDLTSRTWNSTWQLNCLIRLELGLNLNSRTWKSPKETFHCWLETVLLTRP